MQIGIDNSICLDEQMPKLGMEKIRKQQLIDATLSCIEQHGLQGSTIMKISKAAGVSSGIISHYFGGKFALLKETTIYLLEQLRRDFLTEVKAQGELGDTFDARQYHYQRVMGIITANFSVAQRSNRAAIAWLSFWVQSMHSEELSQLQRVNNARLESNLRYSFKAILQPEYVDLAADMMAAQIDGQWLRCALAQSGDERFAAAAKQCRNLLDNLISKYQ